MKNLFSKILALSVIVFSLVITTVKADGEYFTMRATSITSTSAVISIDYSGPAQQSENIQIQTQAHYTPAETFTAIPSKSFQKTYPGLTPNTLYYITIYGDFPENSLIPYVDQEKYSKTIQFTTLKSGSTPTPLPPTPTNDPNATPGNVNPIAVPGNVKPCTSNCGNQNSNFQLNVRLDNPLKVNTITEAIKLFMNIILKIALPFIIIFFIWAGLKFILALGKPEKILEAKKMFWYTIIGTLLILGAWTITNAIIGTVNALTS